MTLPFNLIVIPFQEHVLSVFRYDKLLNLLRYQRSEKVPVLQRTPLHYSSCKFPLLVLHQFFLKNIALESCNRVISIFFSSQCKNIRNLGKI